jgi:hypothetical protein
MDKEFIPYEQALALTELGFDEPCFGFYLNGKVRLDGKIENCLSQERVYYVYRANCLSPTFSQAFRWFREKYDIICHPERWGQNLEYACKFDLYDKKERKLGHIRNEDNTLVSFKTYEEAELECLKKLIEIVKENK